LWGVAFGLLPGYGRKQHHSFYSGEFEMAKNDSSAPPSSADAAAPDSVPAGWYRDPRVPFQLRWWNGDDWSTNVYMPDRHAKPTPEELVPELALHDGKWDWPQA
jgi:hypothetical protein